MMDSNSCSTSYSSALALSAGTSLQAPAGQDWAEFTRSLVGSLCRRGVARHKAEDLAQEAMLRLLTRDCRPEDSGRWLGWARAVALNLLRSDLRRPAMAALEDAEEPAQATSSDADPLVFCEAWAWLVSRVEALPERQERAFRMRRLQDRTPCDASRSLGCTPEQLKRVLHRAMSRLRLEAEAAGWRPVQEVAARRAA